METLVGLVLGLGALCYVGQFFDWLTDTIAIEWQYTWRPWWQEHRSTIWWALVLVVSVLGWLRLLREIV